MGRKKADIDAEQVEGLAKIGCTASEIAAVMDVNCSTITRRFAKELDKGREQGKMSLRRAMWKSALGGNTTMQIWLSKNALGFADKMESKNEHDVKGTDLLGLSPATKAQVLKELGGPSE